MAFRYVSLRDLTTAYQGLNHQRVNRPYNGQANFGDVPGGEYLIDPWFLEDG
jgi:hypothetical protein